MVRDTKVCVQVLTAREAVIAVRAAFGFPCPNALETLVDAAPAAAQTDFKISHACLQLIKLYPDFNIEYERNQCQHLGRTGHRVAKVFIDTFSCQQYC